MTGRGNQSTWRKPVPGQCGGKPVTIHLSYGTTLGRRSEGILIMYTNRERENVAGNLSIQEGISSTSVTLEDKRLCSCYLLSLPLQYFFQARSKKPKGHGFKS
jgi:hypothetical protein